MHFCGHLLRGGVDWNCLRILCPIRYISHLLRGGVDWNFHYGDGWVDGKVTSYAEVWIEITGKAKAGVGAFVSPPTRRCGLKYMGYRRNYGPECHLLRGGVDWNSDAFWCMSGALRSPPTRRCGLKLICIHWMRYMLRHLLRGGVDWNYSFLKMNLLKSCHLLRGGVDWNKIFQLLKAEELVTSYAEVWIEISVAWTL